MGYASSIPSIAFGLRKLVGNAVEVMRTMKRALDPDKRINPGKLVEAYGSEAWRTRSHGSPRAFRSRCSPERQEHMGAADERPLKSDQILPGFAQ